MDFNDIVEHWGSVAKAQSALGLKSKQTLYNWRDEGVPGRTQCRIQLQTHGRLKADEEARGVRLAQKKKEPRNGHRRVA